LAHRRDIPRCSALSDLATVVSKYIGETEKNLRQLLDAATNGESILLFDEADALFGKRSNTKDSHPRYANLEFKYLLRRLDKFEGIAILASRGRENFDAAFLKRFRWIVSLDAKLGAIAAKLKASS